MTRLTASDLRGVIRSAVSGDEIAFGQIVATYNDDMRRVCMVVARDQALADDAVQAAWAIAWRKLGSLRDPDGLKPWLVAIAANQARDLLRKHRRGRYGPPSRAVSPHSYRQRLVPRSSG